MAYFLSSSSSEESLCSESTVPVRGFSKRTKKIPAKLKDYIPSSTKEEEMLQKKEVLVKCSQTGRKIKSKVEDISRKDMSPLTSSDLKKGSSLMVEVNGKSYPVEFIEFAEKNSTAKKPDERVALKPLASNKRTALEAAKKELELKNSGPPLKVRKIGDPLADIPESENLHAASGVSQLYHSTDRNLLVIIDKKLDSLLDRMQRIEEKLMNDAAWKQKTVPGAGEVHVKEEASEFIVNGINLLNLHASDELVYGRMLLDALFTRNEQKDSLVFATIRSEKAGLDRRRVEMLLSCVSRRFPQFNMKELVKNLNQKCRDAGKNQECRDAGKKNKEASSSQ